MHSAIEETLMGLKRFEQLSVSPSNVDSHAPCTPTAQSLELLVVHLRNTTVLSGAEERFAEERPGWNFV